MTENKFANRLRTERERLNLKQGEFAAKLNIPPNTYNGYETGKRMPNLDVVNTIANALGVSVDYLLGRTDIRNYEENTIAAHTDDRTRQLSEEGRKRLDDFIDYLIFEEMKKKND